MPVNNNHPSRSNGNAQRNHGGSQRDLRRDIPRLGFNEAWGRAPAELSALANQAGAKVGRINVLWDAIEPQPGVYDEGALKQLDDSIAALRAQGIRPVLVPLAAPAWARPSNPGSNGGALPPDPQFDGAFGNFVGAMAKRYPGAAAIEVWNEPNLSHYGQIPARRYADMLTAASAGIKAANPQMQVLSAGLSPVKKGLGAWEPYLKTMMKHAKGDFEIALHPYAYQGDAKELARKVEGQFDRAAKISKRDIWITEMGFSTGLMSQQKQSKALVDTFEALSKKKNLDAVILHRLMDDPSYVPDSAWEQGLGMVGADGTEKKAFRMLRKIFG